MLQVINHLEQQCAAYSLVEAQLQQKDTLISELQQRVDAAEVCALKFVQC